MPAPRPVANPRIIQLHREIAREKGLRDAAAKKGFAKLAKEHDANVIRLTHELQKATRGAAARSPNDRRPGAAARSPSDRRPGAAATRDARRPDKPARRDRHEQVKITPENAARMRAHYAALLAALATAGPVALLLPLRKRYASRLNEAIHVMRQSSGGKRHAVKSNRAEMMRLHASKVAEAARLRNARRPAAARAAEDAAENYRQQAVKIAAAERTPGASWEQQQVSPYLAPLLVPAASDRDEDRDEKPPSEDVEVPAPVLPDDAPWYRKYVLPLAIVGVLVGVGAAYSNKGGKVERAAPMSGHALTSVRSESGAPKLKVTRRVFRAK